MKGPLYDCNVMIQIEHSSPLSNPTIVIKVENVKWKGGKIRQKRLVKQMDKRVYSTDNQVPIKARKKRVERRT